MRFVRVPRRVVVIEELASANARLAERVAGLERLVGRNSDNSSMPPSTDDLPGRKAPSRKAGKRSERRRGKQPGAAGAGLPQVDHPDETVQVFPETCADCGAGLADGADTWRELTPGDCQPRRSDIGPGSRPGFVMAPPPSDG